LVDTCILVNFKDKNDVRGVLKKEFKRLQDEWEPVFLLSEAIKFEFMRSATAKDVAIKREEILNSLATEVLPLSSDIRDEALIIGQIYHLNKVPANQVSYVDILNACMMKKYSGSLTLMTLDIQDYPPCLFDTVDIRDLSTNNNHCILSYYRFSEERYSVFKKQLDQSLS
jgi:hypothetical protein